MLKKYIILSFILFSLFFQIPLTTNVYAEQFPSSSINTAEELEEIEYFDVEVPPFEYLNYYWFASKNNHFALIYVKLDRGLLYNCSETTYDQIKWLWIEREVYLQRVMTFSITICAYENAYVKFYVPALFEISFERSFVIEENTSKTYYWTYIVISMNTNENATYSRYIEANKTYVEEFVITLQIDFTKIPLATFEILRRRQNEIQYSKVKDGTLRVKETELNTRMLKLQLNQVITRTVESMPQSSDNSSDNDTLPPPEPPDIIILSYGQTIYGSACVKILCIQAPFLKRPAAPHIVHYANSVGSFLAHGRYFLYVCQNISTIINSSMCIVAHTYLQSPQALFGYRTLLRIRSPTLSSQYDKYYHIIVKNNKLGEALRISFRRDAADGKVDITAYAFSQQIFSITNVNAEYFWLTILFEANRKFLYINVYDAATLTSVKNFTSYDIALYSNAFLIEHYLTQSTSATASTQWYRNEGFLSVEWGAFDPNENLKKVQITTSESYGIFTPIVRFFKNIFAGFANFFSSIFSQLVKYIVDAIKTVVTAVVVAIEKVIFPALQQFYEWLKTVPFIGTIITIVEFIFTTIANFIAEIPKYLEMLWSWVLTAVDFIVATGAFILWFINTLIKFFVIFINVISLIFYITFEIINVTLQLLPLFLFGLAYYLIAPLARGDFELFYERLLTLFRFTFNLFIAIFNAIIAFLHFVRKLLPFV